MSKSTRACSINVPIEGTIPHMQNRGHQDSTNDEHSRQAHVVQRTTFQEQLAAEVAAQHNER